MRLASAVCVCVLFVACGGGETADGGTGTGGGGGAVVTDGGTFAVFTPPTGSPANTFLVTITGEGAATEGLGFPPPVTGGEPYFLDGWELSFERVLVTVGRVTLTDNPDLNPNDPSQSGSTVAVAEGPWAVDLAKQGPLISKEQNGHAWPLVRLTTQNQKGGAAFDSTQKYGFGFSLIAARKGVYDVNLDDNDRAAYDAMVQQGWSVLLAGTATWKGDATCRSTVPGYDFARLPTVVHFSLGFAAPVDFQNCVNPELSGGDARGVQTQTNTQAITQVTFHLDHPFWEALEEDAPLRFDALAAQRSASTGAGGTVDVTMEDLHVDLQAIKDAQGTSLPWRTCGPALSNERTSGTVSYDPVGVPISAAGGAAGLADLADYMRYNLSTFGHLNNDGLCFPARQYPSPH